MEPWILITIAAALAQTLRFMAQKQLSLETLSPAGTTLARFLYASPIVAVIALSYAAISTQPLPGINARFLGFGALGGVCQIAATICVVALFQRRNFAVGMAFKKTEVILAAVTSFLLLGETVSPLGWLGILVGFVGVLLLSRPPEGGSIFNRAVALGIASGVFFSFSAVSYRGATLALEGGDTMLRAGVTLALVTLFQTIVLSTWLRWREPGQVRAVITSWRRAIFIGIFSLIGSYCWFAAYHLQNAAYVNAVGQIELIFSLLASTLFFAERITVREILGMGILTLSIIVIILAI